MRLAALKAWPQALRLALQSRAAAVRVVLAGVRGSTPREAGVGMLVTDEGAQGTIGGGELEWRAVHAAQRLLSETATPALVERLVLAADLGQCCGGVVDIWLERYTRRDLPLLDGVIAAAQRGPAVLESTLVGSSLQRRVLIDGAGDRHLAELLSRARGDAAPRLHEVAGGGYQLRERVDERWPPLWLYGAGHVGQALAAILVELPLSLTWIDSRAEMFPPVPGVAARLLVAADPVATVDEAPAGTRFLVLTHSHALDFALCRGILGRADFAWAGLIGSRSKAARFRSRLLRAGLAPATVARLVCPIGIDGVASKWPTAIAVAVAAQLLQDLGMPQPNLAARDPAIRDAAVRDAVLPGAGSCGTPSCADCGAAVPAGSGDRAC